MLEYFSQQMAIDRLKGHRYHMTVWQYGEAYTQIDHELRWFVAETVQRFRHSPFVVSGKYNPNDLFNYVIPVVAKALCGRVYPDAFTSIFTESGGYLLDMRLTRSRVYAAYKEFENKEFATMDELVDTMLIHIVHNLLIQLHHHIASVGTYV